MNRFNEIIKRLGFQPEYDRLRNMGATENMIEDTFKEITNPRTTRLEQISLESMPPYGKKETMQKRKERRLKGYELTTEYYTSYERPTQARLAVAHKLERGNVYCMINEFLGDQLGITNWSEYWQLDKRPDFLEPYRRRAGTVKKELYQAILEKITEKM